MRAGAPPFCLFAQGYHFARPIPAGDLDALLATTGGRLDIPAGTPTIAAA
jgi:hypothetical protein